MRFLSSHHAQIANLNVCQNLHLSICENPGTCIVLFVTLSSMRDFSSGFVTPAAAFANLWVSSVFLFPVVELACGQRQRQRERRASGVLHSSSHPGSAVSRRPCPRRPVGACMLCLDRNDRI